MTKLIRLAYWGMVGIVCAEVVWIFDSFWSGPVCMVIGALALILSVVIDDLAGDFLMGDEYERRIG